MGGRKVFDFDLLDRHGDSLARPQNETFSEESAENLPSLHPTAERSAVAPNGT
jgi:hypothetical protein